MKFLKFIFRWGARAVILAAQPIQSYIVHAEAWSYSVPTDVWEHIVPTEEWEEVI